MRADTRRPCFQGSKIRYQGGEACVRMMYGILLGVLPRCKYLSHAITTAASRAMENERAHERLLVSNS